MRLITFVIVLALTNVEWPTYGFTYENTRHAPITQIDKTNVSHLTEVWRFALGPHERLETTPIVLGHTMYATTGVGNSVVALNAVTGKQLWRYRPNLGFMSPCCGALNRGVAVLHGRVFVTTLDAQLIALNALNGRPLWHVSVGDAHRGVSETGAPLAWGNSVFVGSSGGDFGIRGFVAAYSADTGKLLWRWYTVSPGWEGTYVKAVHGIDLHRNIAREKAEAPKYRDAWSRGGGTVWMTPALDPRTGVLYVSTANPAPVFDGNVRPGDNLYTDSIVALNARSGRMLWYYQQTPHDVWEYEPASPPVLFSTRDQRGKIVAAAAEAGKTRWLYVLDRRSGKVIRLSQSWSPNSFVYDPPVKGGKDDALPLRGTIGPIAYDPLRHLALITEIERPRTDAYWNDAIVAINVDSGTIQWKKILGVRHDDTRGDYVLAGALSTPGLVFVAEPHGILYALDAANGDPLWQYQLGNQGALDANASPMQQWIHHIHDWLQPLKRALFRQSAPTGVRADVNANPISYLIDGRQYVALGYDAQPESASGGAVISVFALPQQ